MEIQSQSPGVVLFRAAFKNPLDPIPCPAGRKATWLLSPLSLRLCLILSAATQSLFVCFSEANHMTKLTSDEGEVRAVISLSHSQAQRKEEPLQRGEPLH